MAGRLMLATIPSPSQGVWHLGPFPVRAYALLIIVGILASIAITDRRLVARGGRPGTVADVATWAVPFGIAGGRIYHVITDPELYFSHDHWDPWGVFRIWHGGLGIWGAVMLGGVGAWIGMRRRGLPLAPLADALAPGLLVAQAIGRWGNYFNQELFGRATSLPWGLRVSGAMPGTAYHPTFLYESLWDLSAAFFLVWADKRFRLGGGRVFALYVASYTAGRGWIEALRIDNVNHIAGLRLNDWVAMVLFLAAVGFLVARRGVGREDAEVLRPVTDGSASGGSDPSTPVHGPDSMATTESHDGIRSDASDGVADDAVH